MKPLISSRSQKNINRYEIALNSRGIKTEKGMDIPHHPNDFLISVNEEDYSRAMKVLYPYRDTPHINPKCIWEMTDEEFAANNITH